MFIDGLAIGGYRSFGDIPQRICPFERINLFVGTNNAGKSNILRFLHLHLRDIITNQKNKLKPDLDGHGGNQIAKVIVGIGFRKDNAFFDRLRKSLSPPLIRQLEILFAHDALSHNTECVWTDGECTSFGRAAFSINHRATLDRVENIQGINWQSLWQQLHPQTHGGNKTAWIGGILEQISTLRATLPDVAFIPAIRQISKQGEGQEFSGAGVIERLAALQNPPHTRQQDKLKFQAINDFLRYVTANDSAQLEVPVSRDDLLVHMDGRVLPLTSLGTGIHEVVIIASAATLLENQIVCIEEPEIHLHPILQRKLLHYLVRNTSNQYFIATHSAHLFDSPQTAVFRVSLDRGSSTVSRATRSSDKWEICRDLGYRASDLVQANCIIWVEGPSDRIYLNHWIRTIADDLVEGIHYSLMFYGGRLLNHLTALDPEVSDFISLCALNRNLAIVIDSDKKNGRAAINPTKQRVEKEFCECGLAWVTSGREIENYVESKILTNSVEKVRNGFGLHVRTGRYSKALPNGMDKVKVAHEVVSVGADLSVLDLKSRIEELVSFIRRSN